MGNCSFCPKCREVGRGLSGTGYFIGEYNHCDKHNCEMQIFDIDNSDLLILINLTNDVNFVDAMVKLHDDDIIEFQTRMMPFREKDHQQYLEEKAKKPHCPHCNSTDLSKISNLSKAGKIGLFGIFGAGDLGKTYKCNKCGCKF